MTTPHTPTPWKAESIVTGDGSRRWSIQISPSRTIGYLFRINDEDDENAAFIVTACNSFEAMKEALQAISQAETPHSRAMVRTALKLAEGGQS